jgi:hypothetical protein
MLCGTKRERKPNWRAELSHPIVLRDGRVFETPHDASYVILGFSDAVQRRQAWQHAALLLIEAAERGGSFKEATRQVVLALTLDGLLKLPRD